MQLTIGLDYEYKIRIQDPNEGRDPNGQPCWTVFIDGTGDETLSEQGVHYSAEGGPDKYHVKTLLYGTVSSSVVDKAIRRIEPVLKAFVDSYNQQPTRPTNQPTE